VKVRNTFLLIGAILSLGTAAGAATPTPVAVHYKAKLQSQSFGNMGTRELWVKGNLMRWDAKSGSIPLRVVKNSRGVFLINPLRKIAGQYPKDSSRGNPKALLPGPAGSPKAFLKEVKAVKLARESVNKQLCDVYSYTEPTTKRACKLWIGVKSGKPVKLYLKGKHKVMDTVTVTYVAYDEGIKVPDSLFDLPKGYEIRPMPKMDMTSQGTQKPNSEKRGI